jgi:hypothetical protein
METLTKCTGEGCILKNKCFRYTKIDFFEDDFFFKKVPYNYKLNTCEYIWNENAENLYNGIQRLNKPTN